MTSKSSKRRSTAEPRWATPRRPERETLGWRAAAIAEKLGQPPMPHQRRVWDVGMELDPETGLFAYREVIVTMPRQMGKTIIVFSAETERCTMWDEPQRVMYTAQTGSDARKKLLEDQEPMLKQSPLWRAVKSVHRAQGNESIAFRNGSRIGVAAKSESAGHSFTLDLGVVDEAWDDEDFRREQAMIPAMNTRPMAQLWVVSTQGTDKSIYLNQKTELGRETATADRGRGIAYFEWSMPDEADIEDPEEWWRCMPALGWTIQPNVIAHALESMVREGNEAEWRRAFGNQRTRTVSDRIIPLAIWEAVQNALAEVSREGSVYFGLDVHPDRSSATIVASDGRTVELIDYQMGTGWVVDRARSLMDRYSGAFVVDSGGPAASFAPDLEAAGIPVQVMTYAEVAAACGRMYDSIADGRVIFRTAEVFDVAVSGLARKPLGDRFTWARQVSATDITPFMAATLAYAAASNGGVSFEESGGIWTITL